ncbi:terminase [Mycobacterium marinum]|uniref:terminase n=1 Tax=Mycobacterium marinum TaxID=1781 RepID=UPI003568CB8C
MAKIPSPPRGTGPSGRALWRDITGRYELEQHEEALLREMTRCVDQLDALHAITERDGLVVEGPHGSKAHPALTAAQQQRICLARLAASLRLPAGEQDESSALRRPQRRGAARGVYSIRDSV